MRQSGGLASGDRYGWLALALIAAALPAVAWLTASTLLNHDSAWALTVGKSMLAGARLYEDIIEVNPPLAFALALPPVWLAELVGHDPVAPFFFWIFALIALSLLLTAAVVRRLPGWDGASDGAWRAVLPFALLGALILGSWSQFGQREHLLLIFAAPYLFLAAARLSDTTMGATTGRGLAFAVGLFAAVGFALKPYFLLIPALIELRLLFRGRDPRSLFRPEVLALALFLLVYLACIALFLPAYFSRIVPWGLEVYFAYSAPARAVLLRGELLFLFAALAVYLLDTRKTAARPLLEILLIAACGGYAIYAVQLKGFVYHLFPLRGLLILIFAVGLLAEARHALARPDSKRAWTPAGVQGLLLAVMASWMLAAGSYANGFYERALPLVERHGTGGPVYVFGSNVSMAYPLVTYSGLETSWRYPTHWLLPGLVRRNDQPAPAMSETRQARLATIERYVADGVIEDFHRHQPELVLVDVRPQKSYFAERPFDYLDYFLDDPRFPPIWSQYEKVAELDEAHLYRRAPTSNEGSAE